MATDLKFALFDADGQSATTQYFLAGNVSDVLDGAVTSIQDAINGMSDAAIATVQLAVHAFANIGATAPNFYNIADKAVVFWRDSAGQEGSFAIPAPDEDAFSADGETIDISAGAGLTLKAAIELVVKGPSGAPVTVRSIERHRFTRQR